MEVFVSASEGSRNLEISTKKYESKSKDKYVYSKSSLKKGQKIQAYYGSISKCGLVLSGLPNQTANLILEIKLSKKLPKNTVLHVDLSWADGP